MASPGIIEQEISPKWKSWLEENKLADFEGWWQLSLSNVDEGNRSRNGWSQVSFFEHQGRSFYVKKQSNYFCRVFGWPPKKIPTTKAEFIKINWYERAGIPTVSPVYFGWRKSPKGHEAILVTEALLGFDSLKKFYAKARAGKHKDSYVLEKRLGASIRKLHDAGIQHHNLYPKHVLVKPQADDWDIRLIDLETSRPHFGLTTNKIRDVESLLRRMEGWSRPKRLRVLLAYQKKHRASISTRIWWRLINTTKKKRRQST